MNKKAYICIPFMRSRTAPIFFFSVLLFLLASCNGYERVLKSDDINYKLTKANEYYDKRQYQRANTLYESLLPIMKGTKNFEPLYYRYAYSAYYLKDYLSASYHFKNFTDYFPSSKDAEDAEYMHAVCLYKLSPKPSLEQNNTLKAMEAMQSYINTHPASKRVTDANVLMDEMRQKLETKEADAARLYYNINQYKAAGVAYKSVLQNYPESPKSDFYQYMIVRSLYNYARASIAEKQEERFANALNAFHDFKDSYPTSKYLSDATKYEKQATENINKLRHEHQ
ncbi:MAG: outer membrane protein assembly factor BamD [Bacteroidetes bacterium]|nr:outer membrane protein assembly factor BamD [Bacteroidota bacterium]MBS1739874.1 outer membrane protein assembly factor BamD [Bacteroidota bacterium]